MLLRHGRSIPQIHKQKIISPFVLASKSDTIQFMQLYNTLSRTIEEFNSIEDGKVGIYTCGPTVYREIHIGNFRTYITSDILRRALKTLGYEVMSVQNITDVGHFRQSADSNNVIDPVMEEAKQLKITPLEVSRRYTELFLHDAERLHIQKPDVLPKATEHIEEMIAIIKILIEKKFAYVTDGNVYFDIKKFPDYGKLSGNTLDKMDQLLEAVRVSVEADKNRTADFALWKKVPRDSVMKWESPWGEGVPGWHIECTAMSIKYLGDSFDIHCGGEDLIFPHHEDEIAQSEAATDGQFVKYWIHTNFLHIEGEKMSRSKRNVYTLHDLDQKGFQPLAFRYLTFQTHYRAKMNFTWDSLRAAQTALDKLYELAVDLPKAGVGSIDHEREFMDAVYNDLDMPKALSIMWELVRSEERSENIAATLFKMDEILGLGISDAAMSLKVIPESVLAMARERDTLRAGKSYHLADQVRAKIEKMGYIVKDGKKGTIVLKKI